MSSDTFYGYVKRDADSYINWADIGKTLSDDLNAVRVDREKRKEDIEKQSRDYIDILNNRPQGNDENQNKFISDYADAATQSQLMDMKLLKSGAMKLKDYTAKYQNKLQGTNLLFNLSKSYNEEYKTVMERAQALDPKDRSQYLERWSMAHLGKYANINDMSAMIDPTTGMVSVAQMEETPDGVRVPSKKPGSIDSVHSVYSQIKARNNYYDAESDVQNFTKGAGKRISSIVSKTTLDHIGTVRSVADISSDPMYKVYRENYIKSRASNLFNVTSVLTDNIKGVNGKEYTFSYNPADASDNVIILEKDPAYGYKKPKFTPEQQKAFDDYVGNLFDMAVDKEVKNDAFVIPEPRPRSEAEVKAGEELEKAKVATNMLGYLYYGDDNQKTAARTYFRDSVPGVKDVEILSNGDVEFTVEVVDKDGTRRLEKRKLEAKGGNMTQEDFIRQGAGLTGVKNIEEALRRGSYQKGAKFNPGGAGSSTTEEVSDGTPKENPLVLYGNYVDNKVKVDDLINNPKDRMALSDDDVTKKLNDAYGEFGFQFTNPKEMFGNTIKVSYTSSSGEKVTSDPIDIKDLHSALETIKGLIKNNPPGKTDTERMMWLSSNAKRFAPAPESTPKADGKNEPKKTVQDILKK
jgi:hypothetical protein